LIQLRLWPVVLDKLLKLLLALLTAVQVAVLRGNVIRQVRQHKAILEEQQDTETLADLGFLETLAEVAVALDP
jgi:hypothetical protein